MEFKNNPVKTSIFKKPRRGWLGQTPQGAEYMQDVNERARKMKASIRDPEQSTDKRQLFFPGFK